MSWIFHVIHDRGVTTIQWQVCNCVPRWHFDFHQEKRRATKVGIWGIEQRIIMHQSKEVWVSKGRISIPWPCCQPRRFVHRFIEGQANSILAYNKECHSNEIYQRIQQHLHTKDRMYGGTRIQLIYMWQIFQLL